MTIKSSEIVEALPSPDDLSDIFDLFPMSLLILRYRDYAIAINNECNAVMQLCEQLDLRLTKIPYHGYYLEIVVLPWKGIEKHTREILRLLGKCTILVLL